MKNSLKSLLTILLLVVIPTTATAHTTGGEDPSESAKQQLPSPEEQVSFLLSSIHGLPPKDAFDRIPQVRQILEKIALNYDELFQRSAIAALSYYPDEGTLQIWNSLLKNNQSSVGLKMQLLILVGSSFKNDQGLSLLKKYLNDKDPDIRIGAIYGLSNFGNEKSFAVLNNRFKVEKDPYVIEKLKQYARIIR